MQDRDVSGGFDLAAQGFRGFGLAGSFESAIMNLHGRSFALTGAACAWVLTVPAAAQDDLVVLVNRIQLAMEGENWAGALALCDTAIERFGKDHPLETFGPQFGAIHFRKGLCEMNLAKWDDAMRSFEICYRDFPNKNGAAGGNPFEKMALLKWAEAAMGAKHWELAIAQFRKFVQERDKTRDTYQRGALYVGLAVCHYELGRIAEGNENLEIAVRNKARYPTPDSAVVSGFQSLVSAAIAKRDEQALLDFIHKNRGGLTLEPYAASLYTPVLMKLAGDAHTAGMPRAAVQIYQFIPPVETALDDVRARLQSMGNLSSVQDGPNTLDRKRLESTLASLEGMLRGKSSPEAGRLAAVATLHQKAGDLRGAYAALLQLEKFSSESENRENHLLQLIRVASRIAPHEETRRHAESFLMGFPDSPRTPEVRRLLLTTLFQNADYKACIEVGQPMLEKLKPGTPEHDDCLFVLGASYYHSGRHDLAEPLLEKQVTLYPESPHALQAGYFQASNETRRRDWEKALGLLEKFLAAHLDTSGNPYLPHALCDLATCQWALGRTEAARDSLKRATDGFPDNAIVEVGWLMRGDLERSIGMADAAETSYRKALEWAEKRGHRELAGRALSALVVLTRGRPVDAKRAAETVALADRFWKQYAEGSPDRTRVAAASALAYDVAGRGDEGLAKLRDAIAETVRNPGTEDLENLIRAYAEVYLRKHGPEQLKQHFHSYPGLTPEHPEAAAMLRLAVITAFEDASGRAKDPTAKQAADAEVKALFQQLKTGFAIKDLGNFILVRMGDFLRNHTATPREALPYYEEVMGRKDESFRFAALMGRADVFGRSSNPAEISKGIADYERVIKESPSAGEREFSVYQNILLRIARKDFAEAEAQARFYLDHEKSGFSRFEPQVRLCLARTYDERKMRDEAIMAYSTIIADPTESIGVSAAAMLGWLRLMWERNQAGDRRAAYEKGREFLERTRSLKDTISDDDRELWKEVEARVNSFESQPEVKAPADSP